VTSTGFDVSELRSRFPALARTVGDGPAAYLDGPAGTQVPSSVIDAMAAHLASGSANHGGAFVTSVETQAIADAARQAAADLFNARTPDEIVFGQNMTSLTFAMSRAVARTWSPGDEIVVTRLDHDANIAPWVMAAADQGVTVRWVDFDPERGCDLDLGSLDAALGPRTRLVAVTHASNAVGTIPDVAAVVERAHAAGALAYVDAVHYTPHGLVDVQATGCDFLVASAYKFYGPHTGLLYGRWELLDELTAYKVRPAPDEPPDKWETGTQSFESLAGVTAAIDHIAALGGMVSPDRRGRLVAAMEAIGEHEHRLAARFITGVAELPGVAIHGRQEAERRAPTFAVSVAGRHPDEVAAYMGERGIFVWSGHYYAVAVMERLGVLEDGGLTRIGFVQYSTEHEVDRALQALDDLA
jgi:cysteine desulfurase family protein (TIGR01976 family)